MTRPDSTILILGAPRSGTTWLAKIIDSHPGVLYRHEPDEIHPANDCNVTELLRIWIAERGTRTTTKRPFFRKSYQSALAFQVRIAIGYALNGVARLPEPFCRMGSLPVPDLAATGQARIAIKSVRWCDGAGTFAATLPESRTLLIVRHPCGQVASVMRGARQKRFDLREKGTDMPFDEEQALTWAQNHGVDEAAFAALPDAGKYAWSWRAFNETALAGMTGHPNTRIVVYETLCQRPEAEARSILAFTGLDWNGQTARFIARSTQHQGPSGYYAVFRSSIAAAESWRNSMMPEDRAAVHSVVRASPLATHWPDLCASGA